MTQAQADLNSLAARLAEQYPSTNAGHGVQAIGLVKDLAGGSDWFLLTLMGAAMFVLLLAAANVANLELAQASARHKEVALRIALGAGRWRIARQLLVEGVLLSTLGALASLLFSMWGLELSLRSVPAFIVQSIPGVKHMVIDRHVLLFTLAIGVASGIVAALAPAFQTSHSNLNEALKEGGRSGTSTAPSRLRAALVASEVALAMVLLVGAGLMVNGFHSLLNSDLGFNRRHVLTFYVALAENKYHDPASIRNF